MTTASNSEGKTGGGQTEQERGSFEIPGFDPTLVDPYIVKDPEALAVNFARALENLGKAASTWIAPRERGEITETGSEPAVEMIKTLSSVSEYWMGDPKRNLEAQTQLMSSLFGVWMKSLNKLSASVNAPTQADTPPEPIKDKRFADADWQRNPFFDFLRQAYLVVSDWAEKLVENTEGLDEHTRHKAAFYMRQMTAALSPANFIMTNPQLYRETIATHGANLAKGMKMFAEDVAAGKGDLKLRQTDTSKFALGENMALTPGKVIARSDVCEVIQYEPSTEKVLKRPLLICPPWINKFYILDLNPQKSFIKWCVDQGHTVFVISWVNPDERHANKDWLSYIREGVDFALDAVEKSTGEKKVNAIGYCVGGTLLSAAMALHAKEGDTRIASATLFTTQVDFTFAGDLKVFVDEEQVRNLEERMRIKGYLDGSKMATAFNMLRSSELIWPYFVNNYLKGQDPSAFDLLFWNADSTRMGAANHSFYLRNCYLENNLAKDRMELDGKTLSLKDVKVPIYNLATKEDHIAPAKSVFVGSGCFGGPVTYVMSGSGHIAGVVNPPDKMKYQYWTGGQPNGDFAAVNFENWVATAEESPGSWWPHWQGWIESLDKRRTAARKPGGTTMNAIADAPGTYVLERV
ncbi:class I poly(R)-hydroxyalkanoic acid synthase [Allorhizobium terrae]|uniref:Class I poly(R)-hydroxyalkanoic acid synthase n=1 Tax=Allorhizobium terrae TaxID=1848972 RepID=A0A4S4A7T8_9HYPH|nr:class I poly(R)-hydroxyalkanoic acid synthase [Allorhizobium terrae]